MSLCSTSSLKRDILGRKGLFLLALGAVYQIVFQVFLARTLRLDQDVSELRFDPPCDGEDQCLESELFGLWHKESEADLLRDEERPDLLEAGADASQPTPPASQHRVTQPTPPAPQHRGPGASLRSAPSGTAATAARVERAQEKEARVTAEAANLERELEQKDAKARAREEERAQSAAKFDRLYEETKREVMNLSNSSASDLQAQLQSFYDKKPAARAPVETREQRFDRLVAQTEAMLHRERNVSAWARELMASQALLEGMVAKSHASHPRGLRGARKEAGASLQWLPVKAWKEVGPRGGLEILPLTREQLRHADWKDAAPKVGCITAVPVGNHLRIMYAVTGFKLQKYEGVSQLVIVYHHTDEESAKVVRGYADDKRIKGVAFRGDRELPSTMALRYGAWSSDAEVIAQWDFDDVHHPDRLSMQVRALALSGRPASLDLGDADAGAIVHGREASIVGEAAWMREHWHPLLDEESGVMERAQAHNIALVDAPELVLVDPLHHSHHSHATSAPTTNNAADDGLEPKGIEACRELSSRGDGKRDWSSTTEAKIVEEVGEDLGERFRSLDKMRGGISERFASICAEADGEVDLGRRYELRRQAGRMAGIRTQLEEHFAALGKVFH